MSEPKPGAVELLSDRVIKRFRFPEAYFRELSVYRLGLRITPRLLDRHEPEWIALERVDGIPYLNSDSGFDPALLARAVAALHGSRSDNGLCLCHIDNQPGNILWNGQRYMLLDFADSRFDRPETDVSHLLLFWAEEYEPDLFMHLASAFIAAYQQTRKLDTSQWQSCLQDSRERFYTRRARYCKAAPKLAEEHRKANQMELDSLV